MMIFMMKTETHCKADNMEKEQNPMYYCTCGKYLGHRGFCCKKCHDKYYDAFGLQKSDK